jgi:hypothetical protein
VFVVQVQQSMVAKVLFVGVDCISFICWSGQLATTSILFCFFFVDYFAFILVGEEYY